MAFSESEMEDKRLLLLHVMMLLEAIDQLADLEDSTFGRVYFSIRARKTPHVEILTNEAVACALEEFLLIHKRRKNED